MIGKLNIFWNQKQCTVSIAAYSIPSYYFFPHIALDLFLLYYYLFILFWIYNGGRGRKWLAAGSGKK